MPPPNYPDSVTSSAPPVDALDDGMGQWNDQNDEIIGSLMGRLTLLEEVFNSGIRHQSTLEATDAINRMIQSGADTIGNMVNEIEKNMEKIRTETISNFQKQMEIAMQSQSEILGTINGMQAQITENDRQVEIFCASQSAQTERKVTEKLNSIVPQMERMLEEKMAHVYEHTAISSPEYQFLADKIKSISRELQMTQTHFATFLPRADFKQHQEQFRKMVENKFGEIIKGHTIFAQDISAQVAHINQNMELIMRQLQIQSQKTFSPNPQAIAQMAAREATQQALHTVQQTVGQQVQEMTAEVSHLQAEVARNQQAKNNEAAAVQQKVSQLEAKLSQQPPVQRVIINQNSDDGEEFTIPWSDEEKMMMRVLRVGGATSLRRSLSTPPVEFEWLQYKSINQQVHLVCHLCNKKLLKIP